MTDKYAVIGNPISHSKSPLIHEAFREQFRNTNTPQDIIYVTREAPIDGGFRSYINELKAQGFKGLNITVPFKFDAVMYVVSEGGKIDSSAERARAVNTISFNDDNIVGANTDGKGLVADIKDNLGFGINGKKVLILGSGGAAWGVLYPFAVERPESITISSRTIAKAEEMGEAAKLAAKELKGEADRHTNVFVKNFAELDGEQYDIIINATSTGLTDTALPIPHTIFAKGCLAYDMMYGRETPFMKQARENGAQVADGLGMLVEQAAEAFYIWRGVRPETQSVIHLIRNLPKA